MLGAPGAGKGTQAKMIAERYDIPHISTGDIFRANIKEGTELGKKAKMYMDKGELVPDELTCDLVVDRISKDDAANGYVLDGFPRTVVQAEELDKCLKSRSEKLDVVLELRVPEEELFTRLASRGRADDKPEVIRQRLVAYHDQTAPLIGYYTEAGILQTIDGLGSVEDIFGRIEKVLDQYRK